MSQKSSFPNKSLLVWVSANILGFAALGVLLLALPSLMASSGLVPTILIISIPIGLAQWLALRHILRTSVLWIFTVPIGLLFAVLIYRIVPNGGWPGLDDESILSLTSAYFVLGFAIGMPQWLILRRQLSKSLIWLFSSSIAVAAGFWLVLITDLINQSGILAAIVVVFIYPIITGLTLSWLIVYNNHSHPELSSAA
jgi:hypothetical protein